MLRYFYLIICMPMCFCSVYVDSNIEYDSTSLPAMSTTFREKKHTQSLKSRLVQFDVQNFLQGPDEAAYDNSYYGNRDKKRDSTYTSSKLASHADGNDASNEQIKLAEYSGGNDHTTRVNVREQHKFGNPRHFNFHSLDERAERHHDHKKDRSFKNSGVTEKRTPADSEGKCSFRNMRIPFFSRNKATAKTKRHKKRRIFCFNCKKTTLAVRTLTAITDKTPNLKPEYSEKDNQNPPSPDKANGGANKISKRAYGQLCPKCIRELLVNLKKKTTTQKSKPLSTQKTNKVTTKRTTKQKADIEDSLQEDVMEADRERVKRNDFEEQERERRLKELEEVERKIANVHIVKPIFSKDTSSSN